MGEYAKGLTTNASLERLESYALLAVLYVVSLARDMLLQVGLKHALLTVQAGAKHFEGVRCTHPIVGPVLQAVARQVVQGRMDELASSSVGSFLRQIERNGFVDVKLEALLVGHCVGK